MLPGNRISCFLLHPEEFTMESATFRKWLAEQGCRFDRHEHSKRHEGHVMVTVHRDDRKTEIPLGGSREALDPRIVKRACEDLGLDWSQLPGPKSLV
jgi:mRNA interferase HicA